MSQKYLILSEKNIPRYLINQVSAELPFQLKKIIKVKEVTKYTNTSYIFRIDCETNEGKKILYLKQSREYNKRRKTIRTIPRRAIIENEKIKLFEILLGPGIVPHVLYVDYQNFLFITYDIQGNKRILIEEFTKDRVYPQLGKKFGEFFATLHGKTFNTAPIFNNTAWQKRIYRRWVEWIMFGPKKYTSPKVIKGILNRSKKAKKALIWGDPVYRNIFVDQKSFSVLDFDFSMHYDPSLDGGIFLAHWVMKMLEGKKVVSRHCQKFIREFIKTYTRTLKTYQVPLKEIKGIIQRITQWIGAYMVSRTDGQSGSYFKNQPELERKIREEGLVLLKRGSSTFTNSILKLINT